MSDVISPPATARQAAAAVDYPRTSRLQGAQAPDEHAARAARLKKAAQDFESLFIHHLLKRMRATVPKSGTPQFGLETMREITDEQLAIHLARHGGIGLSDMLIHALEQERARESVASEMQNEGGVPASERMIRMRDETPSYRLGETESSFSPLPTQSGRGIPKIPR